MTLQRQQQEGEQSAESAGDVILGQPVQWIGENRSFIIFFVNPR